MAFDLETVWPYLTDRASWKRFAPIGFASGMVTVSLHEWAHMLTGRWSTHAWPKYAFTRVSVPDGSHESIFSEAAYHASGPILDLFLIGLFVLFLVKFRVRDARFLSAGILLMALNPLGGTVWDWVGSATSAIGTGHWQHDIPAAVHALEFNALMGLHLASVGYLALIGAAALVTYRHTRAHHRLLEFGQSLYPAFFGAALGYATLDWLRLLVS